MEILVALFIFTVSVSIATGVLIESIKIQKEILIRNQILTQTSYIAEYMSRALRMAKKDDLGQNCLLGEKVNYELTPRGGIRFVNYKGECQEFYLQGTQLREERGGGDFPLTPFNLEVEVFRIGPSDSWDQNDSEQPRVTIFLKIKPKERENPKIFLQTTISQRNLDIPR